MNSRVWRRGRLASLIVAVVVVGALAVLPVTAYAAKATTRIVAVKSMTVNRNTLGVNPWPKALAVKLQKKITSTHYHALSGTVKLYRYDPQARAYKLVASKKGSSLSFSLPGRGKYKLYYAGSSKAKAATAYTAVYETIGVSVSDAGNHHRGDPEQHPVMGQREVRPLLECGGTGRQPRPDPRGVLLGC